MIEEALEALRVRDASRIQELVHPDVTLDLSRRVLNPDIYHGYEGLERFQAEVEELWEEMRLEPREIVEAGDRALIRFQAHLRGKRGGVPMETEIFQVWTIRDGLLTEIVVVQERDEAERIAGLT